MTSGRKRFSENEYSEMAELRERGWSYDRIASKFNCSRGVVSWTCLRLGAAPPHPPPLKPNYHLEHPTIKRNGYIVRPFTPDEDRVLLEMEANGRGPAAIGRKLGRKTNSVIGRLLTLARREGRSA
jgi:hypothetical protein